MTHSFAVTWAYCWLVGFGMFSLVGIATRIPLPESPWTFVLGGLIGAWITGPIVIETFGRYR